MMDKKSVVKPTKYLIGSSFPNAHSGSRDSSMDRNMAMDMTEEHNARRDEMANTSKAAWFSRIGLPVASLMPPGNAVAVAKATVVITLPTSKQYSLVSLSHSPPAVTSPACDKLKISLAVWFFAL
ncbi:hypothetical protein C1H46_037167 [Malus baccata]|uniref:Uncharacterized protein n=1 Tax=Malus baccata TaxID=106549 RepID=A0A540KSV6_MALBA|nr:hypothetical protein C1H46_037167 [Malus baccata]